MPMMRSRLALHRHELTFGKDLQMGTQLILAPGQSARIDRLRQLDDLVEVLRPRVADIDPVEPASLTADHDLRVGHDFQR